MMISYKVKAGLIWSFIALGMTFQAKTLDAQMGWLAFSLVGFCIHYMLASSKHRVIEWGNRKNPIAIIDIGNLDKRIFVFPDYLEGQFFLVRPWNTKKKRLWVETMLESSGNDYYIKEQLPVYVIRYREGQFCNEVADDFIKRVIKKMEDARVVHHKAIFEASQPGQKKGWEPGAYEREFLDSGLNSYL